MFLIAIVSLTWIGQTEKDHQAENAVFKSLLDPGLDVGGGFKAKLPAPTMPDGLDAAGQKAAIAALIKDEYSYAEFTPQDRGGTSTPEAPRREPVGPESTCTRRGLLVSRIWRSQGSG